LRIFRGLKNSLYIFLCIFVLISCKKKEEEPVIDPNTGCTNCTPSFATAYNGIFRSGTYTTTGAAMSTSITTRVSAFFSTNTVTIPSVANSATVANVFFNGDTLIYSGAPYYYTHIGPVTIAPNSWTVQGSSAIPTFTYKNLKEFPQFSSLSALPDTLRKSIGLTFAIYDLNFITAASVFISDGLLSPGVTSKALGLGSDTLNFTPEDLNGIGTSTTAVITIVMENSHAIKVDGKDFKMSNEATYSRKIVIKN
jgi:hypothetical protein